MSNLDDDPDGTDDTVSYDEPAPEFPMAAEEFQYKSPEQEKRDEIYEKIWPINAVEYGSAEQAVLIEKCEKYLMNGVFVDSDEFLKMLENESNYMLD